MPDWWIDTEPPGDPVLTEKQVVGGDPLYIEVQDTFTGDRKAFEIRKFITPIPRLLNDIFQPGDTLYDSMGQTLGTVLDTEVIKEMNGPGDRVEYKYIEITGIGVQLAKADGNPFAQNFIKNGLGF